MIVSKFYLKAKKKITLALYSRAFACVRNLVGDKGKTENFHKSFFCLIAFLGNTSLEVSN